MASAPGLPSRREPRSTRRLVTQATSRTATRLPASRRNRRRSRRGATSTEQRRTSCRLPMPCRVASRRRTLRAGRLATIALSDDSGRRPADRRTLGCEDATATRISSDPGTIRCAGHCLLGRIGLWPSLGLHASGLGRWGAVLTGAIVVSLALPHLGRFGCGGRRRPTGDGPCSGVIRPR
jgi:hypothetical protein